MRRFIDWILDAIITNLATDGSIGQRIFYFVVWPIMVTLLMLCFLFMYMAILVVAIVIWALIPFDCFVKQPSGSYTFKAPWHGRRH